MKTTGVVRCLDALGRVVIPFEMRNLLNIHNGEPVEITLGEQGTVIIKKFAVDGQLASSVSALKNTVVSFENSIPSNAYYQLMEMIEDAEKLVNDMGM